MNDVWGVVLAAGLGTRLRPATFHCPKPLIPVAGVEPLFFALWKAYELGIRNFAVNTFHLPGQIISAVSEFELLLKGSRIRVISESPEILGTGGALENIFRKIFVEENNPLSGVLVQNGDTLSQFLLNELLSNPAISTLAVSHRNDHLKKYNPMYLDENHRFLGVGADYLIKSFRAVHFLGSYFISKSDVQILREQLPKAQRVTDLYSACFYPLQKIQRSPKAIEVFQSSDSDSDEKFWFDMTNAEYLLDAQQFLLKKISQNSLWHRVLSARYPNGKLNSNGSFVSVKNSRFDLKIQNSVFINESNLPVEVDGNFEMNHSSMVIKEATSLERSQFPKAFSNCSMLYQQRGSSTTDMNECKDSVMVCGDSL